MSKEQLGFALIGCGVAAGFHARAIAGSPDLTLRGVFDTYQPGAQRFSQAQNTTCYASLEELLADPLVDAVCICTPSGLHAPQAIAALDAGKHVLIEKPLAITEEDGLRVVQAAERQQRIVDVVAQLRCYSAVQQLRDAITQGRLGTITLVQLDMVYYRSEEYYQSSPWRGTWAMDGGGALMNQGIHGIDLLLYLLGPVKQVFSHTRTMARPIETEDTAVSALEFENGAICTVAATTSVYPGSPRRLRVCGTKGTVVLTEDSITEWSVEGEDPADYLSNSDYTTFNKPEAVPEEAHVAVIRDFANAIRTGGTPISGVQDGYNAVALIQAMYQSSKTGQSLRPSWINTK